MFVRIAIFVYISIHALREEGDVVSASSNMSLSQFLSTPSARRATCCICIAKSCCIFLSTPSARRATRRLMWLDEADAEFLSTPSARRATPRICEVGNIKKDFYPRPPRGGRRSSPSAKPSRPEFLSTPSARRATYKPDGRCNISGISIHALREEGDQGRLNAPE